MLTGRALTGAVWLVLSRFTGRFIDLFTLVVLARILSPADFGLTALAMTLISTLDMVLEVPIIQALLRRRSFDDEDLNTGFTLGLIRSLVFVLVILAAAWPFAQLYDDDRLLPLLMVLSVAPFMRGISNPAMVRFARDLSFRQTFLTEVVGKVTAFAVAVIIVLSGGGYWAIAANTVMAAVATVAGTYVIVPYRPRLSLRRFRQFAGFAGWFSVAQVCAALNWQLDRILLGRHLDATSFGRYAIASDLSVFPTQSVVGPAMQAVMAAFSSINTDPARMRTAFLKAARFVMMVSIPVGVGIAVTADLVVQIVLGDKWLPAAPILQVLSLAVLPVAYHQVFASFSLALDRPAYLFQISAAECLLRLAAIPAGLWLAAVPGVLGARLAVAVVMFVVYMAYVRRLGGIGLRAQLRNLWRVVLAAAAMGAAVTLLRPVVDPVLPGAILDLAVLALAGAAVYVAALRALGIVISPRNRFGLRDG
ncbi:lipopolysaccharide biosynthesis protein [Frigidibacter sp. MR17.24]|uniref:lipopolysaccharide biosynthesis protein n=1 Tax=Frigidibacter sp. MR17.24 TaxID=3127345 RepID=UPI003012F98A